MKAVELTGKSVMLVTVILLSQGVLNTVVAQTVYKTVDDEGLVTYTDRPTMDQSLELVTDVSIDGTDTDQVDSEKAEADEQAKYDEEAEQIRDNQSQEDTDLQIAMADQRDAACRAANARMAKYEKARRLYRESDGEREYLNDAELDSERADAARAVDDLCG